MDKRDPSADASVPFSLELGTGRISGVKARVLAALPAASPEEVAAMLDRLWSLGEFSVQMAPRAGLVMVTMRDPFDTLFHLGEVLVNEAEVALDGRTGYGAVCGDEPEQALLVAAVAAVECTGRADVLDAVGALLDPLEVKSAAQKALSSRLAAATAVRFESMKKERVDFGSLGG
jgi:phosphonate C-P lyase system protein PhnG